MVISMKTGVVKSFSVNGKYGFIKPEDEHSKDVFFHQNELQKSGIKEVKKGQKLQYQLNIKDTKVFATEIKIIDL
jgi:CspA family cold shock protein